MPFVLAIPAAAWIAYFNSLRHPFIFDDIPRIANDPTLRRLSLDAVSHTSRPLVQASFAIDWALSGAHTWSYHVTNVLIHATAGILLFLLIRITLTWSEACRRYRAAANGIAFAAAVIWVVHPLETEAVGYIVQRGESLASLFYLAVLYSVARAAREERPGRWQAVAVITSVLGMASKPVMVTAPILAIVYDRMFWSGSFGELLRRRGLLHAALVLTIGIVPLLLARAPMDWRYSSGPGTAGLSAADYARTEPGVVLHYLRLALWPHPLCFDYDWPLARNLGAALVPAIPLVALLVATIILVARRNALAFLGIAFFVILAPTSSVIPILDPAFEHRMYLPLAAVVMLAVLGAHELLNSAARRQAWNARHDHRVRAALTCAVVLPLMFATIRRNQDYRSATAIWEDTAKRRPENLRAQVNLAYAIAPEQGNDAALARLEAVLRQNPDYPWAHLAAGYFLAKQGRVEDALPHLERASHGLPASAEAHYLLGSVELQTGDLNDAQRDLEAAVRLEPWRAEAENNLGSLHNQRGEWDAAIPPLEHALQLVPGYAKAHHNLGVALAGKGDRERARHEFETALALDPSLAPARAALDSLERRP